MTLTYEKQTDNLSRLEDQVRVYQELVRLGCDLIIITGSVYITTHRVTNNVNVTL